MPETGTSGKELTARPFYASFGFSTAISQLLTVPPYVFASKSPYPRIRTWRSSLRRCISTGSSSPSR